MGDPDLQSLSAVDVVFLRARLSCLSCLSTVASFKAACLVWTIMLQNDVCVGSLDLFELQKESSSLLRMNSKNVLLKTESASFLAFKSVT